MNGQPKRIEKTIPLMGELLISIRVILPQEYMAKGLNLFRFSEAVNEPAREAVELAREYLKIAKKPKQSSVTNYGYLGQIELESSSTMQGGVKRVSMEKILAQIEQRLSDFSQDWRDLKDPKDFLVRLETYDSSKLTELPGSPCYWINVHNVEECCHEFPLIREDGLPWVEELELSEGGRAFRAEFSLGLIIPRSSTVVFT
ncbi:MAG: hypothetical protein DWQ01_22305 [Planctomycetota bacterium]|nr:MAG: hypothetical protein DWQ01_22305 [Planctomycetota bacterium]